MPFEGRIETIEFYKHKICGLDTDWEKRPVLLDHHLQLRNFL